MKRLLKLEEDAKEHPKMGLETHTYNPSTGEVTSGGSDFKIILDYSENQVPTWATIDR